MKILIVDDEINIARGIKAMLQAGVSFEPVVRCTASGEEALAIAREFRPDLLITDIRMPRMNGLELIDAMKEAGLCGEFLILSGYEDFAYAQEAIRKGVADYLTKPVEREYLCAFCEKCCERMQKRALEQNVQKAPEFPFLSWEPEKEDYPASLRNIIGYIEQNYAKQELSGASISEALFFHPSYISQLIGKYTDRSLNGIIHYFRLKKALELLLSPKNYRVCEVSGMVGYKSERQFYKAFQKYLGCTPTGFRKEYGGNIQWSE
ncbi:MAG: response regulator [Eubacteriales bacterium]|nr:response regulator [Eubacteriales bacterium]